MRVVITGATGTIGLAVADALRRRGDQIVALSRDQQRGQRVLGDPVEVYAWPQPDAEPPPEAALRGADAVVHLLGEPVAQRWTQESRRRIRESRVNATRSLVMGLGSLDAADRPGVLVSQSATGYYGPRGAEVVDENEAPGNGFLAEVVVAWEREALLANSLTRVVMTRTGVVISPSGGALAKMLPVFRLGIGGPVAGGHQFVPWVHIDDVVAALLFCVDDERAVGPVNLTAPNPVDNAEFSHALGRVLKRPAVLPVPGFAVTALYGEMAEMVTTGQRAVPERLKALGYEFRQPQIESALRAALA